MKALCEKNVYLKEVVLDSFKCIFNKYSLVKFSQLGLEQNRKKAVMSCNFVMLCVVCCVLFMCIFAGVWAATHKTKVITKEVEKEVVKFKDVDCSAVVLSAYESLADLFDEQNIKSNTKAYKILHQQIDELKGDE